MRKGIIPLFFIRLLFVCTFLTYFNANLFAQGKKIETNIPFPPEWPTSSDNDQSIVNSLKLYNPKTGQEYTAANANNLLQVGDSILLELNFQLFYESMDIAGDAANNYFMVKLPDWLNTDPLPAAATMYAQVDMGTGMSNVDIGTQSIVKQGNELYYKLEFNNNLLNINHLKGKVYSSMVYTGGTPIFDLVQIDGTSSQIKYNPDPTPVQKTGELIPGEKGKQNIKWTIYGNIDSDINNLYIQDNRVSTNFKLDNLTPVVLLAGDTLRLNTDYTISQQDSTGFKIVFNDTGGTSYKNKQIKVEFVSTLKDNALTTYTNEAILGGSNIQPNSKQSTVVVKGPAIQKTLANIDYINKVIDWTIIYNKSEANIPKESAQIVDLIIGDHTYKSNSLQVYTDGNRLLTEADTTYSYDYKARQGGDNSDTLTIKFLTLEENYFINRAYTVKYQTTFESNNSAIEGLDIRNTISNYGITIYGYAPMIDKRFNEVDYRTDVDSLKWTIQVNQARKNLDTLGIKKVEDIFHYGGQSLTANDILIKNAITGDTLRLDTDYTIDLPLSDVTSYPLADSTISGKKFVIEKKSGGAFLTGTDAYTIIVKTKFSFEDLTYPADVADADKVFKNTAVLLSDKPDSIWSTDEFVPHYIIRGHGSKTGSYNYQKKEFTWMVSQNINNKKFPNPLFTDTIRYNQKYVESSFRVGQLYVNQDGSIDSTKSLAQISLLTPSQFEVKTINDSTQVLSFSFNDANFNKAVYWVYKTTMENRLINEEVFYNTATMESASDSIHVSGRVPVKYGETFLEKKSSSTDPETGTISTTHIYWNLLINPNRSTLTGVIVRDTITTTPTPNAAVLDATRIHLFGTTQTLGGDIQINTADTISPTDYLLEVKDNSFKLTFKNKISDAYILRYESFLNTDKIGEKLIKNDAKLYALEISDTSTIHNAGRAFG